MVKQEVAVVVVPFPAQGHLNSLLHLSRHISAYNIPVYYVSATTHIRQATARLEGCDCDPSTIANLHFHDFSTPPFPNLSPDHSADSSTKFPSHMLPMIMAILSRFQDPLHDLLLKLSSGRVIVIFDALMATVVNGVHQKMPNIECYSFMASSAFYVYSLVWEAARLPADAAGIMKELPSMEGCYSLEFQEFLDAQRKARNFHSGSIYNSSKIIEGAYLDSLAQTKMLGPGEHWVLGPMSAVYGKEKQTAGSRRSSKSNCMDWLDEQPPNSVIFVSFGTTSSISEEQIGELALGLERSEQRFIWSLRDADKGDIFEGEVRRAELPLGFEERVRERGVVVRDWAPQLEILEHCATGGFLSHCGWNSSMESISLGVPIAAWPMHSDQPRNALLITKVLKIGVEVRDWARSDELVGSVAVEQAVRRLMASAEGEEMRRRAAELAEALKQSMVEGGAGRLEMDSFVDHIACVHIDSTILTNEQA